MPIATPSQGARPRSAREDAGFTLVEMLVALLVLAIIVSGALGFFMTQNRAFAQGSERSTAALNLMFAMTAVSRDLATAGTNLGPGQPFLVYAGADVVAFNADYASSVADPFAVYHDPDAPSGTVLAPTEAQSVTIPNTSITYPDTTYPGLGSTVSPAELLVFFLAPDTLTSRTDDFVLYRQVNGAPAELISRDLVAVDGQPFFSYVRLLPPLAGVPRVGDVPDGDIPLRHSVVVHGGAADTGSVAAIDSIRGVRLTFGSVAPRDSAGAAEVSRMLVWLPNADLRAPRTCGGEPIFGSTVSASIDMSGGAPAVRLSWSRATDEAGGEQDVMRYVIYRHRSGDTPADEAYQSIPAGNTSYLFTDRAVVPGETWVYGVAAQDCTPSLSPRSAVTISVPGAP